MDTREGDFSIRRLAPGDARALAKFYNGLSVRSRRTFRPLGWATTVEACAAIVRDNQPAGCKMDLVAWHGPAIVGWSFVWHVDSREPSFGLGVADAFQGRGLGSRLMDRTLEAAMELGLEELYLTVVQDNHIASGMYGRRGFCRYGEFVDDKDGLAYYRMRKTMA